MTLRTLAMRLFARARRVRYAVATGGDASWRLEARRRRSPARSNKRRGHLHRHIPTAESVTREEGENTSGRRQVLNNNPRKT